MALELIKYFMSEYKSLKLIKYFISYNTLTSILALVTLVVVAWVFVMIIRRRRTEHLQSLAVYINSIPFFAGLIPLTGFLTKIYSISRAISSIKASGTGDPRVVAAGFQQMFILLLVSGGLFFILLQAWLVMRMIYGRFLHELDTLP